LNIRDKKLAIRKGRDNYKALYALHRKSFGFKVEGPDTYIWTNNNATPNNWIAEKDMVEDEKCYKVKAKSYELFKGSWFVTHEDGDIFFLNGCEVTLSYFDKYGWEAFYREGNNVKYKRAKQGDYKVPHLCFGWKVLSKKYLDDLKKEVAEDKKETWYTGNSIATYELETAETFIKKESITL